MTKFEIGSLWRTRGGDKVMVVDVLNEDILGYNYHTGGLHNYEEESLLCPWKERITVKERVGIFKDGDGSIYPAFLPHDAEIIAIKEIEIEVFEGEGL